MWRLTGEQLDHGRFNERGQLYVPCNPRLPLAARLIHGFATSLPRVEPASDRVASTTSSPLKQKASIDDVNPRNGARGVPTEHWLRLSRSAASTSF